MKKKHLLYKNHVNVNVKIDEISFIVKLQVGIVIFENISTGGS